MPEKEMREKLEKMWPKYIVVDKLGWPVTGIIGKPIISFLCKLIHGRGIITRGEWVEYEINRMNVMTNVFTGAATKQPNPPPPSKE